MVEELAGNVELPVGIYIDLETEFETKDSNKLLGKLRSLL